MKANPSKPKGIAYIDFSLAISFSARMFLFCFYLWPYTLNIRAVRFQKHWIQKIYAKQIVSYRTVLGFTLAAS